VGIVMGSRSDWPTMREAAQLLAELGVAHESKVVSAHRTPDRLVRYAKEARDKGIRVIIAGAGGAAHLPGMIASMTTLPVLGVPVGTLAIGEAGAFNAGLLAASILAGEDKALAARLEAWREAQTDKTPESVEDAS
jgi:5-(carboxyamino)imidazole ribonucleotide mutase